MKKILLILSAGLLGAPLLHAKFMMPQPIPVERLVASAERYLKAKPEDPQGHYTLARIHYAAFAYQSAHLNAFPGRGEEGENPPALGDQLKPREEPTLLEAKARVMQRKGLERPPYGDEKFDEEVKAEVEALKKSGWRPDSAKPAEALRHFVAARDGFDKAITMEPGSALFALGKASLWRQFSTPALHEPLEKEAGVPAAMKDAEVAELFYRAFSLAKGKDAELKHLPIRGVSSIISNEAGIAYLELAADGPHAAEVKAHLELLKKLKMGAITPLVFSTRTTDHSLDQLVDHQASAAFDLRGMGEEVKWPWLRSHAAFLVWNGDGSGVVRDGRQFFGTYTWGVFWRDGFEALSMLDDNGDGSVSGAELNGIGVWQDANGNAVSDSGEVRSPSEMGIQSIACSASVPDGDHLLNASGITMQDGTQRPLWDWMALPAEPEATTTASR